MIGMRYARLPQLGGRCAITMKLTFFMADMGCIAFLQGAPLACVRRWKTDIPPSGRNLGACHASKRSRLIVLLTHIDRAAGVEVFDLSDIDFPDFCLCTSCVSPMLSHLRRATHPHRCERTHCLDMLVLP